MGFYIPQDLTRAVLLEQCALINLALNSGIKVYECHLTSNLLAADEVFITNAIKGVIDWCI